MSDAHRAYDIIRNVRNTLKKGEPTRSQIDLNELVTNVAHVVRPDAVGYSCKGQRSLQFTLTKLTMRLPHHGETANKGYQTRVRNPQNFSIFSPEIQSLSKRFQMVDFKGSTQEKQTSDLSRSG